MDLLGKCYRHRYARATLLKPTLPVSRVASERGGLGMTVPPGTSKNTFPKFMGFLMQGSLNYLFWGGSNLMQVYGNVEEIPL